MEVFGNGQVLEEAGRAKTVRKRDRLLFPVPAAMRRESSHPTAPRIFRGQQLG